MVHCVRRLLVAARGGARGRQGRARRAACLLVVASFVAPPARAGDLVSAQKGSSLVLSGGSEGALFVVDGVGLDPGGVRITPGSGVTLDGDEGPGVFAGVSHLSIVLVGGDNTFTLTNLDLSKGVSVQTGDGVDDVTFDGGLYGKRVDVALGGGDDALLVHAGTNVTGRVTVDADEGDDTLELSDSVVVTKDVRLDLGDGSDAVEISGGVTILKRLTLDGGAGNDSLLLTGDSRALKSSRFDLGPGDDGVVISSDASIGGSLRMLFGDGDDLFTLASGGSIDSSLRLDGADGALTATFASGSRVERTIDVRCTGETGMREVTVAAGASVGGGLRCRLGDGTNRLTVATEIAQRTLYQGGAGADSVEILDGGFLDTSLTALLGDGENDFTLADATIFKALRVRGGADADTFTFSGETDPSRVGPGSTRLQLGDGSNVAIATDTTFMGPVRIVGGVDDDTIDFSGAVVQGKFKATGKGGKDSITPPWP
ncbi:MAG: hypothetical protein H6825_06900 [Planctomycetes bacterium]|nr:hypothetical protein [Planctomycetota bacterium]